MHSFSSTLVKITGLPLVLGLFLGVSGCTEAPSGVEPITGFEPDRYLGQWYEIARLDHSFERGLSNVTASYAARDDGKIGVTNRGFDQETCMWDEANASARFLGSRDIGSLAVTFFWPFAGGYHIVELDQDEYQYALVSGPSREYLWILARNPTLPDDTEAMLIDRAARLGFPTEDLIFVDHSGPDCSQS